MLQATILVILTEPLTPSGAADTITRAKAGAFYADRIRFALPAAVAQSAEIAEAAPEVLTFDRSIAELASMLNDETHFLLLSGPHAFAQRWDASLYGTFRSLPQKRALLTACITPCRDQTPALSDKAPTVRLPALGGLHALRQAMPQLRERARSPLTPKPPMPAADTPSAPECCLPALRPIPDGQGAAVVSGMPLVCAPAPAPTSVINPGFVFGPVDFLDENGLSLDNLSLTAFLMGYGIHVLHEPYFWPLEAPSGHMLRLPEVQPATAAARFAQLTGLAGSQPRTQAKAALGLFGAEETYLQRMPLLLLLQQKAASLRRKFLEKHPPMCVSAFIDLPGAPFPQDDYTLRFGFLRQLDQLPLLLYTGGSQERLLRAALPNTQSYPDNALLPLSLLQEGMTKAQHFARSKPLLMQRAAKRHAEFTHMVWTDLNILSHPIPAQAFPRFETMMDDRIHLAAVNGVPDASFLMVPVRYLDALAREVLSITRLDAELKRGFGEELLWERLFMKHPDWFVIHPMPRRRLLFLTAFDKRLLSKQLQQMLSDLPAPFRGTPADGQRASANDPSPQRSDFF